MDDAGSDTHDGTSPVRRMPEAGASLSWAVCLSIFTASSPSHPVRPSSLRAQNPISRSSAATGTWEKKAPRPAPMVVLTSFESALVNPDTDRRTFHTVLPCFREKAAETGGWNRRPDAQAAQVDLPQCPWALSIFF